MKTLSNFINGTWCGSGEQQCLEVINPANQESLGKVPCGSGTATDMDTAVQAASSALSDWRNTPVMDRVQPLYKLKSLLEQHKQEIAETITLECGKTLTESLGEMTRAIENVEMACATPALIQSEFSEDIARGIDEFMIRQPVGVCACIVPFNFPGMIPFWFFPYAIACGNTFIVKPSERVPNTMNKVFQLLEQVDLPAGVINMVHGGKESVNALLTHPDVKAISFVGSSSVAKYVYATAAANGKRVQAQGGAKNPVVVLPDADLEMSTRIIADSVYGCAGQRCLAASSIIAVGEASATFREAIAQSASSRVTGFGLEEGVDMGPVITPESRGRIESLIQQGIDEGAKPLVDGRNHKVKGFERGNFIAPTILENIPLESELMKTEIFGPVMSLTHMPSVDEAIQFINSGQYGNMACLFTSSGSNARKFRKEVNSGNVGINIGVAAPMAQFPFSGWKDSFYGDLHGQGRHAIEFFTQTKVVVERWPKEWSRKF
jgi:malonate-semialdehyde dehydrogenase (acetylating)/methylmalonate-semialdehyde dehydrogenase